MPGIKHISNDDYSPLIRKALEMPSFTENTSKGEVTLGFGRSTVFGVADKIIDAIKAKQIRHFSWWLVVKEPNLDETIIPIL